MPDLNKIIKNSEIVSDEWQIVTDSEITSADQLPEGKLILPLTVWQAINAPVTDRELGVWLNSDESPEALKDSVNDIQLIAINFPVFGDGRGYSYANILRTQYEFKGELRAIGDVLMDQVFYMKRVGFNSFDIRDDQDIEEAINHLKDFSVTYQAAADNDKPLFLQR